MQPFGQESHQVVLEVHADILRLRVKDVFLLLTEHLNVVLSLLLLLLLNDLLKVFFLLDCCDFRDGNSSLSRLVLGSSLCFLVFIVSHVVIWFLISFNVNLKAIKGIVEACANVLLVEFDALLMEKVLDGGLSNLAVIDGPVLLDSPLHIFHSVVSPEDLILWEFSHTVD